MTESRDPNQIGVQEAQRLKERFLTRATAVFFARVALLTLVVAILLVVPWRRSFALDSNWVWLVVAVSALSTWLCQLYAAHPEQGRRVIFITLLFDLAVMWLLTIRSGGFHSPVMPAQLLYVIFFALLFPNPIAIVPPLCVLPAVILGERVFFTAVQPSLSLELLRLAWLAALNGVAVYVIVYLTSREEKHNREILELEQALGRMALVEERNRLARDIHDGLGASLSGLIIQAEYLHHLGRGNDDMQREIRELKSSAEEAIDEVRRAVSMWRDDFQLVPQLENMCTTFTSRHRLPVELTLAGTAIALTEEQELTIFRIVQECLTNIAKHAAATKVQVAVSFGSTPGAPVVMDIVDDGRGFDPTKTPKNHYGLINMRERARKAHGDVSINSSPGQGTRVRLSIRPQT
jgi:two-component system, NarL family, sensor histidine kinase DegS